MLHRFAASTCVNLSRATRAPRMLLPGIHWACYDGANSLRVQNMLKASEHVQFVISCKAPRVHHDARLELHGCQMAGLSPSSAPSVGGDMISKQKNGNVMTCFHLTIRTSLLIPVPSCRFAGWYFPHQQENPRSMVCTTPHLLYSTTSPLLGLL